MDKVRVNSQANEVFRQEVMTSVREYLVNSRQEDVMQVAGNKFVFPFVNSEGGEGFMEVTFSVPKGPRDGSGYDGYAMAEDYKFKQEQKAVKAEKARLKREAGKASK